VRTARTAASWPTGASRRITLTKLAIIGCAYAVFLVATLMATLVFSALTA
jgi:hypothetical protein